MNTLTDYLYAKAAKNHIPLGGTFELSPVCNFSCKMCYVRKTHQQIQSEGKRLRTAEEWLALAKKCADEGMLYLLLTGGEPFLYPGFKELYIALHKMGLVLSINSNGTMIDEQTVAWLKDYAPSRINITLYGANEATYQRICGNREGYHRAVKAIRLLLDAKIPVVINSSMIPENADDLEEIVKFGQGLGINTRVATYMFPPVRRDAEESDSRFTPEESARLNIRFARCAVSWEAYIDWLERKSKIGAKESAGDWGASLEPDFMKCRAGRSSFWISWDGTMTACGIMAFPRKEYPFEDDFAQCWKRLNEAVLSSQVLASCAGCPRKELCRPCAAMVASECGDVNGKPEYLCALAKNLQEKIRTELEEIKHEN